MPSNSQFAIRNPQSTMSRLTDNPLWRLLPGNPIFVRVVETAAKRTRHAMIRIAYLAGLVAVALILVAVGLSGGGTLTELSIASANLFKYISFIQLGMACLMAPIFTAGAITQEKDNQTYNVLLATPLSNAQIVLGSLVSRLFFVLVLLAGGIPVFLITQLFGGVSGSSILLSFMIAAATAVFTGAVAVAIAVVRVGAGKTIFAFYVVISLYLAVIWFAARLVPAPGGPAVGTSWLTALHPFLSLTVVLNINQAPTAALLPDAGWLTRLWLCHPHYAYLCWTLGCSAIMVLLGTIFVRYSNARTRTDWRRKFRLWLSGGRETRKPRTVWRNPVAWREAATRASAGGKSFMRWVFLAGGLAVGAFILWLYAGAALDADLTREVLTRTLWVEFVIVLLVLCNVSADAITREREDGTLDLLLVTPVTSRYYIWGKLRGLISFAAILLIVPIGTAAMFALHDLFNPPAAAHVGRVYRKMVIPVMPITGVLSLAGIMLAFCALAAMVALTMSLKVRRTIGAVIGAIAVVGATAIGATVFGYAVGDRIPLIGPVLALASPFSAVAMTISPATELPSTLSEAASPMGFYLVCFVSTVLAMAVYALSIFTSYRSMVRTFDMIIRKQSR